MAGIPAFWQPHLEQLAVFCLDLVLGKVADCVEEESTSKVKTYNQ